MKGADQTVHMLRLVCAFVVRMKQNQARFSGIHWSLKTAKTSSRYIFVAINRQYFHKKLIVSQANISICNGRSFMQSLVHIL